MRFALIALCVLGLAAAAPAKSRAAEIDADPTFWFERAINATMLSDDPGAWPRVSLYLRFNQFLCPPAYTNARTHGQ
jgi:hypothetical protein